MPKTISPGKCRLCGELLDNARMSTHLKHCAKRTAPAAEVRQPARCFHLLVEGTYSPQYWLHLEVPAKATFGKLDDVLRDIWLECCGHMSAFNFPRKRVRFPATGDIAQMFATLRQGGFGGDIEDDEELMRKPVGTRLAPGVKFDYEYDFGSTTKLSLRVVDERPSVFPKAGIHLLARNEPPEIPCKDCQKPATQICGECECQGNGALCESCAKDHECGDEMFLPVLNTPRAGVCGYTGPSREPK